VAQLSAVLNPLQNMEVEPSALCRKLELPSSRISTTKNLPPKVRLSGNNPCTIGEAARIKLRRTILVAIQAVKL
jgi:hypothetical protein